MSLAGVQLEGLEAKYTIFTKNRNRENQAKNLLSLTSSCASIISKHIFKKTI